MTDSTPPPDHLSPDERLKLAFDSLGDEDVRLETPPASVWEAIAAEIAEHDDPAKPAPASEPAVAHRPEAPDATVTALGRRAAPFWAMTIAAGLAVLAVVALSSSFIGNESSDLGQIVLEAEPKPPTPEAIAVAELEALEDGVQTTTAELIDDGTLVVQPDLAVQQSGYYEVWLLDATAQQLVSLGPLREDGRYTVPPGVSTSDFPIVDISIEAPDGNPAHSGRSVLRGTLA